jgi:hypothetical protein
MSPGGDVADLIYVTSRKVLLDTLDALGAERAAVILVGAQAVHFRVGEAGSAVVSSTTDADLSLNPQLLTGRPDLASAMRAANLTLRRDRHGHEEPGIWISPPLPGAPSGVTVDLLVAAATSTEKGKRAAVLTGQDARAARYVYGIEATLYDNGPLVVPSLDDADPRSFEIAVAGPAALLIAKLIKLTERLASGRLDPKDAFEIYRLLQGDAHAIAEGWLRAEAEAVSRPVAAVAESALRELFAADASRGAEIAGNFARGRDDPATVSQSARALAQDLLATLAKVRKQVP